MICLFNATPVPRAGYTIGVAEPGRYRKLFDSDEVRFGGSGYSQQGELCATADRWHEAPHSLKVDLPPLAAVFLIGPA